jgi:hypothetical protein
VAGKTVGLTVRIVSSILGLVLSVLGFILGILLLPLLPLLLLAGLAWVVARALRPRTVLVHPY